MVSSMRLLVSEFFLLSYSYVYLLGRFIVTNEFRVKYYHYIGLVIFQGLIFWSLGGLKPPFPHVLPLQIHVFLNTHCKNFLIPDEWNWVFFSWPLLVIFKYQFSFLQCWTPGLKVLPEVQYLSLLLRHKFNGKFIFLPIKLTSFFLAPMVEDLVIQVHTLWS